MTKGGRRQCGLAKKHGHTNGLKHQRAMTHAWGILKTTQQSAKSEKR